MKNTETIKTKRGKIDILLLLSMLLLSVFGFFMVLSAEMGEGSADINLVSNTAIRQIAYLLASIVFFLLACFLPLRKIKKTVLNFLYFFMLILLILPRFFTPVGGAYAWIRIGGASIQPSEFAKMFAIFYGAKILSVKDDSIKENIKNFIIGQIVYVFIIIFIQKDLGSGFVLLVIDSLLLLIPTNIHLTKVHKILMILILIAFALILFLFSSLGVKFLSMFKDDYRIARILVSANPFEYQYDVGYHVVTSLESFARGGLFGNGYTKSIIKFMNFPNTSTDFILPIIVEELGFIRGFLPILIAYSLIIIDLVIRSFKTEDTEKKMVYCGTFIYLILHFILNVGGVSGFVPLTGVPLLLISSGGSSMMAFYITMGIAQNEIMYKKVK